MAAKKKTVAAKKPKKQPIFTADLQLTRINENNIRYRVINHEGIALPISHLEFDRSGFPADDDFNMDFIMNDLALDAEGNKPSKKVVALQKEFRELVNFKMVIS